jgi:hypothetical protein
MDALVRRLIAWSTAPLAQCIFDIGYGSQQAF